MSLSGERAVASEHSPFWRVWRCAEGEGGNPAMMRRFGRAIFDVEARSCPQLQVST